MKRIICLITSVIIVLSLCACTRDSSIEFAPEEKQIKNICELATLKCYYHNVAMIEKSAGKGVLHWLEKDRDLWIEYTGYAKIGVDMSKVTVKVDGSEVAVAIPDAEVLYVNADEDSMVYYISEDGKLNPNEITAEEQREAVAVAQEEMTESAQNNTMLIMNAQERAKELIENYIQQLADAAGVTYHITWVSAEAE